jgi:hypothetical protein
VELAGLHDITIKRGASFSFEATYEDAEGIIDLTGVTARLQAWKAPEDETVLLELSSQNGHITIDAENGTVSLHMTKEETAALDWSSGVYDLSLFYSNGDAAPLLEGNITVAR